MKSEVIKQHDVVNFFYFHPYDSDIHTHTFNQKYAEKKDSNHEITYERSTLTFYNFHSRFIWKVQKLYKYAYILSCFYLFYFFFIHPRCMLNICLKLY